MVQSHAPAASRVSDSHNSASRFFPTRGQLSIAFKARIHSLRHRITLSAGIVNRTFTFFLKIRTEFLRHWPKNHQIYPRMATSSKNRRFQSCDT